MNHETEKVQGICGKLELKPAGSSAPSDIKAEGVAGGEKSGSERESKWVGNTSLCTHKDNLKVDEQALEQMNHETEKVQGICGKLELKPAGSYAPSEIKAEGVV